MSPLLALASPVSLALAALASLVPASRQRFRPRLLLPLLALVALGAAVTQLAMLWDGTRASLGVTLSPWTARLFTVGPRLEVDALAAYGVLLVCLASLVALLHGLRDESLAIESLAGPLAVASSATLFCAATRSPLGLVSSWLLMDLALFFGAGVRRRGLLAGQLGLLFILAGLMGLADPSLVGGELGSWPRLWLLAAAGIRMGTYPFSWALPRTRMDGVWRAGILRLGPAVAGATLAIRAGASLGSGNGVDPLSLLPGALAMLFGGLLAWLSAERGTALDWAFTAGAGLLLTAAALGSPVGTTVAALLLADLVLGRLAQYLAEDTPGQAPRLAWGLSAASLAGLPPLLGFFARVLLYRALLDGGHGWVLLTAALSTALTAAPFGRLPALSPRTEGPSAWQLLPLGPALPLVLLGLLSGWLPFALSGAEWSPMAGSARALLGLDWRLISALLVPPLLGFAIHRSGWGSRRPPVDAPRRRVSRLLRLTELFDGMRTALIQTGRMIHRSLGLVEGHRTMALTLLAAVGVGLTVLAGAGPLPDPVGPGLDGVGMILWGVATLIAVVNLLVTRRLVTLIILWVSYLLVAAVLLVSGGTPTPAALVVSALVKGLAGIVVVAILSISVVQLGADGAAGAARRAPLLAAEPSDRNETPLRLLALCIAVLLTGSLHATTLQPTLPDMVLRPALTLIVGGVLTAIFARSPLRLAVSVLVALCGFELIYARLDPGLFMTGSLAAFHILFAILASLYVGLALDPETA
ncbi:MAG: hypothetical protein H6648_02095 [Caldilineae bacterium]|nr:hypothetical protein [Chloroflexota bacterium]MCB9175922.1 hypothetical protein [Caldilineae bacterium]